MVRPEEQPLSGCLSSVPIPVPFFDFSFSNDNCPEQLVFGRTKEDSQHDLTAFIKGLGHEAGVLLTCIKGEPFITLSNDLEQVREAIVTSEEIKINRFLQAVGERSAVDHSTHLTDLNPSGAPSAEASHRGNPIRHSLRLLPTKSRGVKSWTSAASSRKRARPLTTLRLDVPKKARTQNLERQEWNVSGLVLRRHHSEEFQGCNVDKTSILPGDYEAFNEFVKYSFNTVLQIASKEILTLWIKVIEPRKQTTKPYSASKEDNRSDPKLVYNQIRHPDWWPRSGDKLTVPYIEPHHLKKGERQALWIHIINLMDRELAIKNTMNAGEEMNEQFLDAPWTNMLRTATFDQKKKLRGDKDPEEKFRQRMIVLEEFFRVAETRENILNGLLDRNTQIQYRHFNQWKKPKMPKPGVLLDRDGLQTSPPTDVYFQMHRGPLAIHPAPPLSRPSHPEDNMESPARSIAPLMRPGPHRQGSYLRTGDQVVPSSAPTEQPVHNHDGLRPITDPLPQPGSLVVSPATELCCSSQGLPQVPGDHFGVSQDERHQYADFHGPGWPTAEPREAVMQLRTANPAGLTWATEYPQSGFDLSPTSASANISPIAPFSFNAPQQLQVYHTRTQYDFSPSEIPLHLFSDPTAGYSFYSDASGMPEVFAREYPLQYQTESKTSQPGDFPSVPMMNMAVPVTGIGQQYAAIAPQMYADDAALGGHHFESPQHPINPGLSA